MDRAGFQRLVAEVGLGHVGLGLGLEVSRLARSSVDWHQVWEICALTGTLILDEDGLDDPATFHDRLVLGLKGTRREAERQILPARLRGGILHKAQRAAWKVPLPVGLISRDDAPVGLDPDAQVQEAIRLLFATFERTNAAWATVKAFRAQGVLFPRRVRAGAHAGEIHWAPLIHNTVLKVLRHPRYAGAFCYGRTHTTKRVDGSIQVERVPRDQWPFLFRDAHPGSISWEQFEAHLAPLRYNCQPWNRERDQGPPREGPALLQGLAICGKWGRRMTVRSHQHVHGTRLFPEYLCQRERLDQAQDALCQYILGAGLDAAAGAGTGDPPGDRRHVTGGR